MHWLLLWTDEKKGRLNRTYTCIGYEAVSAIIPASEEAEGMTNADKIRAMTDEELATWFTNVCHASAEHSCYGCKFDALECTFLMWLKQEAE